ncbi:MAG: hypothetical protein AMS21_10170 [Gemmatimonas sp. SG8_38_2]|nr:MAG: hypothetical protein AMS21_10170 [Gemmatimonas sp. SG8_38_2]
MSKGGIVAALLGIAAIVLVFVVVPGMRDAGYIIRAYVITAVILTVYTWSLAKRLAEAEKIKDDREELAG